MDRGDLVALIVLGAAAAAILAGYALMPGDPGTGLSLWSLAILFIIGATLYRAQWRYVQRHPDWEERADRQLEAMEGFVSSLESMDWGSPSSRDSGGRSSRSGSASKVLRM